MRSGSSLFAVLLGISAVCFAFPFHPKQQFTTDFKIWTQYNTTLAYSPNVATLPFVWSQPLSPFQGKMYFDWDQQGFRLEVEAGPGAPYDLSTTIIVHPSNYEVEGSVFNVTWNIYEYLEDGRCWYQSVPRYNLPVQLDQLDPNITFVAIQEVDGFSCAVFNSSEGNVYAVRLSDLSLIRASLPFLGDLPLPIPVLTIHWGGDSLSWIDMYNPAPGPIDPKYFDVPSGECIFVNDTYWPGLPTFRDATSYLADFLKGDFLAPKPKPEPANQMAPRPPAFAQAFTAKFLMTVFPDDSPPFQPYNISGKVAFDFDASGFYGMINSIDGPIPVDFQTGFIVNPSRNGVELLLVSPEGQCYSIIFLQWLWTYAVPLFALPPDTPYAGEEVVNGDKCSVWIYDWDDSIKIYVREKDNVVVQIKSFEDRTWTQESSNILLTDIELSVDPSIYSRPPVCSDTMVWNRNFYSHLPWYWCSPICS